MNNLPFLETHFESNPESIAIIDNGKTFSYRLLELKIKAWENVFSTSPEGKVVAIKSDFSINSVSLLLYLITKKAIIVPISPESKNLDERIRISEAELFIDFTIDYPNIQLTGQKATHELISHLKTKQHPGIIIFSSGTTGTPKAAIHDFTSLLDRYSKPGKAYRSIVFLLFDHWGGINTLLHVLSKGGTACFIETREPDAVCEFIQDYKVDLLPSTPTFLNLLLLSKAAQTYDLSSLKTITYGTEPMHETTLKELNRILPNVKLKQTYGLTELGVMQTTSKSDDSLWLKVGGEGYETKIVNNILFIRTKSSILGYLNAENPFDSEGWYNTGDLVEVDGDWIRFLGRDSDMINVGGQKAFPAEIESTLLSCSIVGDCIVFGEKNPFTGMHVACDVLLNNSSIDINEARNIIKNHCKGLLDSYKIPVRINFIDKSKISERFKKIRKR